MKTNETLQKDVQDAIKWEPQLNAAEIGVTVKDGIVTLTGTVDSYARKLEAETATEKVGGVKAIIEKIDINIGSSCQKDDHAIATEVVNAFAINWSIPKDKVTIKVEDGWVSLGGELPWDFQKEAVQKTVKNLPGIKGITNTITIKADSKDKIEKEAIERALLRNWSINYEDITVTVTGNRVTLTGIVTSVYQKEEAGRLAWNAPGVWSVDNELVVEYAYESV